MSRTPVALALVLAALGTVGVSCTAIFAPRDDVQRCGSADECDPTGDKRYVPVCRFDESNVDLDSSQVEKICLADFKPDQGCSEAAFANLLDHPYTVAFDELGDTARYVTCDDTQLGLKGCPPNAGSCGDGLSVNDAGLCDDGNPQVVGASELTTETVGQDIRDQFCRSYFCDERFVCDTSTNFCVLCDPDEPFGEGGCGEIFISGARSCVYETYSGPNDGACAGPDASADTVTFGSCM